MSCKKCGGLMVVDRDPESTGIRCINCGSQGAIAMTMEPKTDRQTDRQRCAYKPNRFQCKADALPGSPYCGDHQDVETKPALAPKKTRRSRPPGVAAKVAADDPMAQEKGRPPVGEIDAAIAKRLAEIETLKAAKALIE